MKSKSIPYLDQLLELGKLYKVDELKFYAKSKKKLTTSQIELILLKNKIRLPEQRYNKKKNSGNKVQRTGGNKYFNNFIFNYICN